MIARIVQIRLQKLFRYEMIQHEDIEELFDPYKSDQALLKRDSENDNSSEKKEEAREVIVQIQMIIYQRNH